MENPVGIQALSAFLKNKYCSPRKDLVVGAHMSGVVREDMVLKDIWGVERAPRRASAPCSWIKLGDVDDRQAIGQVSPAWGT